MDHRSAEPTHTVRNMIDEWEVGGVYGRRSQGGERTMPELQLPPARGRRASREFEELWGRFEEEHCMSVLTQEAEISTNNFANTIQDGAHTLGVTMLDFGWGEM